MPNRVINNNHYKGTLILCLYRHIHKRIVRFQRWTIQLLLTLHGQNLHRQQWQLSKFLMRYQQIAPHAYCGAAGPVSKMASQQEKAYDHLLPWPPRSPDLTPCDFCLWGFVKDSVYVPPLSMSLMELRDWITYALQTITADMLHRVWDEFDYRVDVCCVTQGAHIEELWVALEKLGQLQLLTVCVVPV
jgi:hypothetical protein